MPDYIEEAVENFFEKWNDGEFMHIQEKGTDDEYITQDQTEISEFLRAALLETRRKAAREVLDIYQESFGDKIAIADEEFMKKVVNRFSTV